MILGARAYLYFFKTFGHVNDRRNIIQSQMVNPILENPSHRTINK